MVNGSEAVNGGIAASISEPAKSPSDACSTDVCITSPIDCKAIVFLIGYLVVKKNLTSRHSSERARNLPP